MSDVLHRKLDRARARIATLESMIENQTRDLYRAKERLSRVLETVHGALFVIDPTGEIALTNAGAAQLVGLSKEEIEGKPIGRLLRATGGAGQFDLLAAPQDQIELELVDRDGTTIPVLLSSNPLHGERGEVEGAVCIGLDLRQRRELELELRQAQRLESIGQLAAGIAHEINTPIQFVGDSAQFLAEAWDDLQCVLDAAIALRSAVLDEGDARTAADALGRSIEEADLEFLAEEIPGSVERMMDGVARVARIVSAMKVFSHPGGRELAPADINHALETTLIVARNEYKYVAEVDLDLGTLPEVQCEIGGLNQVFLNIIVNAAHAIESNHEGELGRISIRTSVRDERVVVEISDDGGGIPEEIRERIFDPFFTTKQVGRGTGQGLAIARKVVERHGGELRCVSSVGVGTTFTIELPIEARHE